MSSYKKPLLESFGSFRDVTKFGFLSFFFSRLSRWRTRYRTHYGSYGSDQPTAS